VGVGKCCWVIVWEGRLPFGCAARRKQRNKRWGIANGRVSCAKRIPSVDLPLETCKIYKFYTSAAHGRNGSNKTFDVAFSLQILETFQPFRPSALHAWAFRADFYQPSRGLFGRRFESIIIVTRPKTRCIRDLDFCLSCRRKTARTSGHVTVSKCV